MKSNSACLNILENTPSLWMKYWLSTNIDVPKLAFYFLIINRCLRLRPAHMQQQQQLWSVLQSVRQLSLQKQLRDSQLCSLDEAVPLNRAACSNLLSGAGADESMARSGPSTAGWLTYQKDRKTTQSQYQRVFGEPPASHSKTLQFNMPLKPLQ